MLPSSKKIIGFLVFVTLVLILIHSIILVIYFTINDPQKFDFIRMFDLDMERNVPTLFSSFLFAIASFLFYLLSRWDKIKKRYWFWLSVVFIFLSFDESAKIHEQLGDYTANFVTTTGYLHYPWFISYSIFVLILAFFYTRFFWNMPKNIRLGFIFSAFLFLTGAIGFDMLGGKEASEFGTSTLYYSILYTIEESLEMFGLIALISVLFTLLKEPFEKIR